MPSGRPTKFTQDIADKICFLLMEGISLREIVKRDDMPVRSTVHKWLTENKTFSDQYAQAREFQADTLFDEILEIADDATNDYMKRKQGDEEVDVINHEHVQRSRLRVDARKWQLSKMFPKKYGDKVMVGGDAENPIVTKELSDIEYARRTAFLLQRASRERSEEAQGDDGGED